MRPRPVEPERPFAHIGVPEVDTPSRTSPQLAGRSARHLSATSRIRLAALSSVAEERLAGTHHGRNGIRLRVTERPSPWPIDSTEASARVLRMQAKLHRWAVADTGRRFDEVFALVYDVAFLAAAWDRLRTNTGARTAGVDQIPPRSITPFRATAMLADLGDQVTTGRLIPGSGPAGAGRGGGRSQPVQSIPDGRRRLRPGVGLVRALVDVVGRSRFG